MSTARRPLRIPQNSNYYEPGRKKSASRPLRTGGSGYGPTPTMVSLPSPPPSTTLTLNDIGAVQTYPNVWTLTQSYKITGQTLTIAAEQTLIINISGNKKEFIIDNNGNNTGTLTNNGVLITTQTTNLHIVNNGIINNNAIIELNSGSTIHNLSASYFNNNGKPVVPPPPTPPLVTLQNTLSSVPIYSAITEYSISGHPFSSNFPTYFQKNSLQAYFYYNDGTTLGGGSGLLTPSLFFANGATVIGTPILINSSTPQLYTFSFPTDVILSGITNYFFRFTPSNTVGYYYYGVGQSSGVVGTFSQGSGDTATISNGNGSYIVNNVAIFNNSGTIINNGYFSNTRNSLITNVSGAYFTNNSSGTILNLPSEPYISNPQFVNIPGSIYTQNGTYACPPSIAPVSVVNGWP